MAVNSQKNKFLIDGFPRNEDNLQGWNKTMDGKADVAFVLFFDCDNEVIAISICLQFSHMLYDKLYASLLFLYNLLFSYIELTDHQMN